MAAGLHNYTVVEAQNAALGQAGAIFEDGTTAITGKKIIAITFVGNTTFDVLLPETDAFIGTSGGSGDAIDSSQVFPAGLTIYGRWTGFTLAEAVATGGVIAYLA